MKNNSFFLKFKHIHFIGIGGISMSALAKLCLSYGVFVSGSDRTKSEITDELEHIGAIIYIGHKKSNVQDADLVVFTCAVKNNNVELLNARKLGIKIMERADFLGELSNEYNNVIAVSGSHGKSTVCAMLGSIFLTAQKKPTILVGGESDNMGNLVIGEHNFLIVEACEYMEHFLKVKHDIGIILNIDYDHPDYYKTQKMYQTAFQKFSLQSKTANFTNEKYSILIQGKKITFGTGGDYTAKHISHFEDKILFDVYKLNKFFTKIDLNCIGTYNVLNALCAIAVSDFFGIEKNDIKNALKNFQNIKRRYEYMGKLGDNIVITDYAHHPTQIANCILATREIYSRKITVVFEPHTYSRTKALMADFVKSLMLADNIILLPTYSARECKISGGSSRDIFNNIKHQKIEVQYIKSYKTCLTKLKVLNNNIILILGAGTVNQIADKIKAEYKLAQDIK